MLLRPRVRQGRALVAIPLRPALQCIHMLQATSYAGWVRTHCRHVDGAGLAACGGVGSSAEALMVIVLRH